MGSKNQASIRSGPPHHAHNNTTAMQYKAKLSVRSRIRFCTVTAYITWIRHLRPSCTGWLKKVSCWHSTTAYFFWATLYTLCECASVVEVVRYGAVHYPNEPQVMWERKANQRKMRIADCIYTTQTCWCLPARKYRI